MGGGEGACVGLCVYSHKPGPFRTSFDNLNYVFGTF